MPAPRQMDIKTDFSLSSALAASVFFSSFLRLSIFYIYFLPVWFGMKGCSFLEQSSLVLYFQKRGFERMVHGSRYVFLQFDAFDLKFFLFLFFMAASLEKIRSDSSRI